MYVLILWFYIDYMRQSNEVYDILVRIIFIAEITS